jgi:hypothetical protein
VLSRIVAYVPDLMDRSKITNAATVDVVFVRDPADLAAEAASADLVVVDLQRPGVLDVLPDVTGLGVRTIAFGAHVDRDLMDAGRAAGCDQVFTRSAFFCSVEALLV